MRGVALLALTAALCACGESADSRRDRGYSDGYAEGYNTTCEIRATLIAGEWDDEHYSSGYASGRLDGAAACHRDKEAGTVQ